MLHDATLIESDLSHLSDSDWQAIIPTGHSLDRVKSELEQGDSVVLRDAPTSPVFTMEQGKPLASLAPSHDISVHTLTQLTRRFGTAGSSSLYTAHTNGNLPPSPPLDYIADSSRVRETPSKPKPALISDNFGKPPDKLELKLCYDDSEKTHASHVPYSVIFDDPSNTVIKGVLNVYGWAMVEGGPNYPAQVIFGNEADKAEAEKALESQYKQLDSALDEVAKLVAQQAVDAKDIAKRKKLVEVTESFKLAVDSKIVELKAQSEAFDNLSNLSQSWELFKAGLEGTSNGFTEYLPDLGEFGELMEAVGIDITMLIEAIVTGDINALEAKLKQWQDRGGKGFKEAHKAMETLILLLSDPTSREMLTSVPKRILAALPQEQIVELTAYQMTQMGMDAAVVTGGTAVGALAGGVGGPVAATILFGATTGRKTGKVLESTIKMVIDISKSLKKINNQHKITPYKKKNELPLGKQSATVAATKKALTKRKTPDDPDFAKFKSMNHKKAAAGEFNAHELMKEKGYTPLGKTDGKYVAGETGIDGIYYHPGPPPKTAIVEAKYNTARLGRMADGSKQMDNDWIDAKRLEKAGLGRKDIRKVLKGLKDNDGSVEKLLIRNKPNGNLVVKTLDKNAKIIGETLGF